VKIGDQNPVSPPALGVDPAAEPVAPTSGAGFADRLEDLEGVEGADAAGPLGDLEALAARIDRGELQPAEAMRLIVEQVLDAQLGPDSPPAIRDQARAFVEDALTADPHLAALIRRLEGSR
jgi:hypothetical protein